MQRELPAPTLCGARIVLDQLVEQDAAGLFAIGQEERVWTYLPRGPFHSREDALGFIRTALAAQVLGGEMPFAIRLRASGLLVGTTRLMSIQPRHLSTEIGWTFLHPSQWTRSAPIECLFLLFGHAIQTMGANRVWMKTDARNKRVVRVLEHAGLTREGCLRRHFRTRDGFFRDSVIFSVLAEEWTSVLERNAALLARVREPGE